MSKRKNYDPPKEPRDYPRELLAWLVADFADGGVVKSERHFYADEIEGPIPSGKAVKVTFEFVDEKELTLENYTTCGTCGGRLPK